MTFVNGIAPGTAKYQRVGNKVAPAYVDMQLTVLNNSTTTPLFFKYALVWDKQPTGTLPNYSDIYQNVNAAGTSSTSFFVCFNNVLIGFFFWNNIVVLILNFLILNFKFLDFLF